MISIVSMSRRPSEYSTFVKNVETQLGDLVEKFYVFENNLNLSPFYKNLEINDPKIKVFTGTADFVYKFGHDSVYNFLDKQVKSKYILKLFDVDEIEVNKDKLVEDLTEDLDIYGIPTYMERGDVWETKYQLYKPGLLDWYGLVHENQHFKKEPKTKILDSLKVIHKNARDKQSKEVQKTEDNFIILEEPPENSDSDLRNMLYEYLGWKIAIENGRHDNPGWFKRNYQVNQKVIDKLVVRAKKLYKL